MYVILNDGSNKTTNDVVSEESLISNIKEDIKIDMMVLHRHLLCILHQNLQLQTPASNNLEIYVRGNKNN